MIFLVEKRALQKGDILLLESRVKKIMLTLMAFVINVTGCGNQMSEEEIARYYCEQWRKGEMTSEFAYNALVQGIVFKRSAFGRGFADSKDYEKQLNKKCSKKQIH